MGRVEVAGLVKGLETQAVRVGLLVSIYDWSDAISAAALLVSLANELLGAVQDAALASDLGVYDVTD